MGLLNCCRLNNVEELLSMGLLNCCRLNNLEELLSMGLYINELNMYDGSRDMVMAGWQHASKLESLIEQVNNTLSLVFV